MQRSDGLLHAAGTPGSLPELRPAHRHGGTVSVVPVEVSSRRLRHVVYACASIVEVLPERGREKAGLAQGACCYCVTQRLREALLEHSKHAKDENKEGISDVDIKKECKK